MEKKRAPSPLKETTDRVSCLISSDKGRWESNALPLRLHHYLLLNLPFAQKIFAILAQGIANQKGRKNKIEVAKAQDLSDTTFFPMKSAAYAKTHKEKEGLRKEIQKWELKEEKLAQNHLKKLKDEELRVKPHKIELIEEEKKEKEEEAPDYYQNTLQEERHYSITRVIKYLSE